ncbi:MAG: hypothetical protein Q4C30_10145 [Bacteroidia bacterium]|nr:hypothetical protein [Bacteroidia bacterium]
MNTVTLTPAQIHILNMASRIKTEEGLNQLKDQMAAYYAKLIDDDMEELWESGQWSDEKLDELREMHLRTEYKS